MLKIQIEWLILLAVCLSAFSCQDKQVKAEEVESKTTNEPNPEVEPEKNDDKVILFYGNSLTAGYGLDEDQSFPALVQNRIDSLRKNFTVVNAGLSGETTAGGKERIDWVLRQKIDLFVLELGGNDMLRGLNVESTEENLRAIIKRVREKYPDIPVIIAGMQAPPNMGPEYTKAFSSIYPKLAKEFGAGLIPFLLDGVAQVKELNLPDGIHPNTEGQKVVLENVWHGIEGFHLIQ